MDRINGYLICTICKRNFFTKTGFQLHQNKEHPHEQDYIEANPVSLVKERSSKSAEKSHSDGTNEMSCISESSENVEKENDLESLKIQQEDCKKITLCQCQQCDNVYVCNKLLAIHISSVHNKIKLFQCQLCKKTFSYEKNLKRHIQVVHDKITLFRCQLCKKTFSYESSLKRHIRGVHDKIKPFQCQQCNKSFFQKISLQEHMLGVHEKIKPFQCQQCNKCYTRKINLQQHVQQVHE